MKTKNKMNRLFLLIIFFTFSYCAYTQGISVPAASMPTKNNQLLVDSLLKVTKFETYFINYCEQRIDARAKEKKWSYQQIADAKKQINYKYFKEITLYNFYSFFSAEQLTKLIKITSDYNSNAGPAFIFITNPIIQQNLENEINSYYNAIQLH